MLTIDNEDVNNTLEDDKSENKDKDEYNISSLFERLLLDEKYIKFLEIIEDIRQTKKPKKRFKRFRIRKRTIFCFGYI